MQDITDNSFVIDEALKFGRVFIALQSVPCYSLYLMVYGNVHFDLGLNTLLNVTRRWDELRLVGLYPASNIESILVATSGPPAGQRNRPHGPSSASSVTYYPIFHEPVPCGNSLGNNGSSVAHEVGSVVVENFGAFEPVILHNVYLVLSWISDIVSGTLLSTTGHDIMLSAHENVLTIMLGDRVMMIGFSHETTVFIDARFQCFVGKSHSQGSM
eukprot:Ihof_evm3s832 gene=Ihof_evmTU3s832